MGKAFTIFFKCHIEGKLSPGWWVGGVRVAGSLWFVGDGQRTEAREQRIMDYGLIKQRLPTV